ncbi:MAG: hypothetical protein IPH96_08665 [Saprospiraceae bacterium]|nr:hypothetical protein [Saprospiraceae bacterium]
MKQCLIIFTFIFVHSILFSQSGFSTIIPRSQEYVEGIAMPAIELTKNKIVVVSVSSYRTQYGSTAFYNELNANGELVVSKTYLDSLNRILCYHDLFGFKYFNVWNKKYS